MQVFVEIFQIHTIMMSCLLLSKKRLEKSDLLLGQFVEVHENKHEHEGK